MNGRLTEDSVRTHGALTEDSRRAHCGKGREVEGKGSGYRKWKWKYYPRRDSSSCRHLRNTRTDHDEMMAYGTFGSDRAESGRRVAI